MPPESGDSPDSGGILNENPVSIRDRMPGLEKHLASIVDKALVRNPKDRLPDAGKLLVAISP